MPPLRKRLPIGIQNLREIRQEGYYYMDKTEFALRLIAQGKYYFLSRPRRFGKSLFLDTLKELFEGNEVLFEGLHAAGRWDWSVKYPVIRISFGASVSGGPDALEVRIGELLNENARRLGILLEQGSTGGRLMQLIRAAHEKFGQPVVVLIDEYDKPILDNIEDPGRAKAMREGLKDLYSVLKDADPYLKFVFLTGVSRFSKVSLFSGLNNLNDITVDREYSALCGYTDADIDTVFAPELAVGDAADGSALRQIKEKDYAAPYRGKGEPIHLIGIEFSKTRRALLRWEVESVCGGRTGKTESRKNP